MSRSLIITSLASCLTWVGLAHGQTAKSEPPALESRVWKKITVVEANRPAEQCVITKVWRTSDGTPVMLARSLANTSARMTIVEESSPGKSGFRVFRWSEDGVPPAGSPLPPEFAAQPKSSAGISVVRAAGPDGESKPPMPPAAPEKPSHLPPASNVKELPKASRETKTAVTPTESKPVATETRAASVPTAEGVIGQIITVREPGKPEQKCRIEEIYLTGEGERVIKLKGLDTGETISLVDSRPGSTAAAGSSSKSRFRILRNDQPSVQTAAAPSVTHSVAQTPTRSGSPTTANPTTSLLPPDSLKESGAATATKNSTAPSQPLVNIADKADWKKSWGNTHEPPATTGRVVSRRETVEPPAPVHQHAAQAPVTHGDIKPPAGNNAATTVPTEPKAFEDRIISSKVIDEREVETPAADANRLSVPVPLVPLITSGPSPNVPPPQPPAKPFNTMESNAVIRTDIPKGNTSIESVSQPVTTTRGPMPPQGPTLPLQTNPLVPTGGPVNPSLWSRGPVAPVTNLPIMARTMNMNEIEALAMHNTVFLLTVLQGSGEPAQREWAAQRLHVVNDKTYGFVIEALATAAKSDHAPLVRSAAVQSLAQIGARESHVIALLEEMKNDRDPRVRDEVASALESLKGKPVAKTPAIMVQPVQPAGR